MIFLECLCKNFCDVNCIIYEKSGFYVDSDNFNLSLCCSKACDTVDTFTKIQNTSDICYKPGSHITVMVPAVPAAVFKAEYDYGTCVLSQVLQAEFNLVPGTAGTVQPGKENLMSLC